MKAKKRPLEGGESTPKSKRGRPRVSLVLTRYPPINEFGDDEVSLKRNIDQLSKEMEKERPRKEIVLSLVRQTFSYRRGDILSEATDITVSELLGKYPELKKPYVVSIAIYYRHYKKC